MVYQIITRESLRKSAHEAFLAGKTIDDCPLDMLPYHDLWEEEFRLAQFEIDCSSN